MQCNYHKLNQKVFDVFLEATGKTLIQDEINEIIVRLIKPAFHQGCGKGNPFIDYIVIEKLFEEYNGDCAWLAKEQ